MLAGLPLNLVSTPSDIDLGDLCQTYCTAPMRQVGEDCSDLKDMYRSITAACDTNENGTRFVNQYPQMCNVWHTLNFDPRCYDLRESTWPLWTNCSGNTSLPCTQDCANAMLVATDDMGCCFNSLLNGSQYDYSPFNGGDIWDHCGVPIPEGPCSTAVQIQTDMLLVLILICCIILTS